MRSTRENTIAIVETLGTYLLVGDAVCQWWTTQEAYDRAHRDFGDGPSDEDVEKYACGVREGSYEATEEEILREAEGEACADSYTEFCGAMDHPSDAGAWMIAVLEVIENTLTEDRVDRVEELEADMSQEMRDALLTVRTLLEEAHALGVEETEDLIEH